MGEGDPNRQHQAGLRATVTAPDICSSSLLLAGRRNKSLPRMGR
jgi:hypothetical protein